MKFATRAIHVGSEPDAETGAVTPPIYQTSTFVQKEPGVEGEYVYSRSDNPTRAALERNLASLEEGKFGLAYASGMAAVVNVLSLSKSSDHVIAGIDLYGGVPRLFNQVLAKLGLNFSYVDTTRPENVETVFGSTTRLVWIETPSNPTMKLADINRIADITHHHKAQLAVDNTFASPYLQKPLTLGADIVMHSATKYLGGHADLLGGALVVNDDQLYERLKFAQNAIGAVPSAFDCWLTLRGIKTLHVRMERHCQNAMAIARFLESHGKIQRVMYPGLTSHPQHDLALRQMSGFGGMLSFEMKGGYEECRRLLTQMKVLLLAESLGGVESLVEHPASMTHSSMSREERERAGVGDGLIRVSVGIEDQEDLIADLSQALTAV